MSEIESRVKNFHKSCLDKLGQFNYVNIEKTIYHYTKLPNFISIIDTQTFYFTPSKHLNDTKELLHGFEIIKDIINKNNFPKSGHCVNVTAGILEKINFYISSFSIVHDNLSLWRLYGDDGYGIALGINPDFVTEINDIVEYSYNCVHNLR